MAPEILSSFRLFVSPPLFYMLKVLYGVFSPGMLSLIHTEYL